MKVIDQYGHNDDDTVRGEDRSPLMALIRAALGDEPLNALRGELLTLTPEVEEDIAHVLFDTENVEWETGEVADGDRLKGLLGLQTPDAGIETFGMIAGGDWEHPVFLVLYAEGETLRAVVPDDGNLYNREDKTAYGNDEASDVRDLFRRGFMPEENDPASIDDFADVYFDGDRMKAEIVKTIRERRAA